MKRVLMALALVIAMVAPVCSAEYFITSSTHFGCLTKGEYQEILDYAADGDRAGFGEALIQKYATYRCMPLKVGTAVFVQDIAVFSGLVKIRIKGSTVSVWTASEAINR
jgi:hypothetical protein